jgi:hypothetical protein
MVIIVDLVVLVDAVVVVVVDVVVISVVVDIADVADDKPLLFTCLLIAILFSSPVNRKT